MKELNAFDNLQKHQKIIIENRISISRGILTDEIFRGEGEWAYLSKDEQIRGWDGRKEQKDV